MKKVYIAGPLFNEMELERNLRVDELIRSIGFNTYLPQRDGGVIAKLKEMTDESEYENIENKVFMLDIGELNKCDFLLFLLDGAVLDDGSCFELGYMYALGKKCYGYKTDLRNWGNGKLNLMIDKSLIEIVSNKKELARLFRSLVKI